MTSTVSWRRILLLSAVAGLVAACASGPRITRTLDLSDSADAPYENILVVALFSAYETRWRLESELTRKMSVLGIDAVASTSLMTPKTPVTRAAFVSMVEEQGSDAVLVTRLLDIDSKSGMVDSASPEGSYKFKSTYFYNVFEVEQDEFIEPQILEVKSSVLLATELYSVQSGDVVWAIESKLKLVSAGIMGENQGAIVAEADAIADYLARDGLIAP